MPHNGYLLVVIAVIFSTTEFVILVSDQFWSKTKKRMLYQFWRCCLLRMQINLVFFLTNFVKTVVFPIILRKVVGSDTQCLSPPRPSSKNLTVHYKFGSLNVKLQKFSI